MKRIGGSILLIFVVGVLAVFCSHETACAKSAGEAKDTEKAGAVQTQAPSPAVISTPAKDPTPAAGQPLLIREILLKKGTVHVVLESEAGVQAADYGTIFLEVEPAPAKWALLKIDPKRRLAHKKGRVTFDTGIAIKARAMVKVTLVQGSWQVSQTATLSPAQTTARPAGEVKAGGMPDTAGRISKPADMPSAMRAKQVAKPQPTTVQGQSPAMGTVAHQGQMAAKEVGHISFYLPRGGEYWLPGEEIAVNWHADLPPDAQVIIHLKRGADPSRDDILFSGPGDNDVNTYQPVELPRGLESGDDYYLQITSNSGELWSGNSRHFSIGPPRDAQYVSREEWRLDILSPAPGTTLYKGARSQIRWRSHPEHLPFPDSASLQIVEVSSGETVWSSGSSHHWEFDAASRTYARGFLFSDSNFVPGDYRVEIQHDYDSSAGSELSGSLAGQSGIFHIAAAPSEPAVSVIEPHPGITIHRGGSIPFRWEISSAYEIAYGRVVEMWVKFEDYQIGLYEPYEQWIYLDPGARFYNLPVPPETFPGEGTASIYVKFEDGYQETARVEPIDIFPADDLYVTWPASGRGLHYGERYTITWEALGEAVDRAIDIRLMQRGSIVMVLQRGVPAGDGRWEWDLDINCSGDEIVPRGANFNLALVSNGIPAFTAESVSFDLLFPEILFDQNAPAAGELWPPGSTRRVQWSTAHMPRGATLKIELQKGGHIEGALAASVPADRGFFEWYPVGQLPEGTTVGSGDDFRIRLELESCDAGMATSPAFRIPGGAPAGSYLSSCRYAYLDGTTLHATCLTNAGEENIVYLERQDLCTGDISNYNGELMCQHASGLPYGSYLFSCTNAHMNYGGGTLIALCPTNSGSLRRTTINPVGCTGDISNNNGQLTCPR